MKKKIAIMLTLILATGTFTACTAEEKMNNDIKTSVVLTRPPKVRRKNLTYGGRYFYGKI